jgi:hypothetical protein
MEPVGDYVQQIDRLLSAGCATFPDEQPATAVEPAADSPPPSAPDGASGLAAATRQADARYRDVDARIAELTGSIDKELNFAAAQALQAGMVARTIRDTAQSQAEAINTAAKNSECN